MVMGQKAYSARCILACVGAYLAYIQVLSDVAGGNVFLCRCMIGSRVQIVNGFV